MHGKKCKKGIFSDVQWWKEILTHFSDSTHQECMLFAKIGHGSCYHHWNEIFAGVTYIFVERVHRLIDLHAMIVFKISFLTCHSWIQTMTCKMSQKLCKSFLNKARNHCVTLNNSKYGRVLGCTFLGEWKNLCSSKFVQTGLINKTKARSSKNCAA